MRKVLILEILTATPHTETSIEIALKEASTGSEVIYVPAYLNISNTFWATPINGDINLGHTKLEWFAFTYSLLLNSVSIDFELHKLGETSLSECDQDQEFQTTGIKSNLRLWPYPPEVVAHYTSERKNSDLLVFRQLDNSWKLAAYQTFCIARGAINKYKPDLVYLFNGRLPTAMAARKLCELYRLPYLIHERGSTINKYAIFRAHPSNVAAWSDIIQEFSTSHDMNKMPTAAAFYKNQKEGKLTNFGYTQRNNLDQTLSSLNLRDSFVVYFATSHHELETQADLDIWNTLGSTQLDIILSILSVCRLIDLQLVVRMHPNDSSFLNRELLDSQRPPCLDLVKNLHDGDSCVIIPPESTISSYRLGESAKFRLTMGSTIGWELSFQGYEIATVAHTVARGDASIASISTLDELKFYLSRQKSTQINPQPKFASLWGNIASNFGIPFKLFRAVDQFRLAKLDY